jgi:hypothetical protein
MHMDVVSPKTSPSLTDSISSGSVFTHIIWSITSKPHRFSRW